jgi:hypothetical protein
MKTPTPVMLAIMNKSVNNPELRVEFVHGILRSVQALLSVPQETYEQLFEALRAPGSMECDCGEPGCKEKRDYAITLYSAINEALPGFRKTIHDALNRAGAKLPDWV